MWTLIELLKTSNPHVGIGCFSTYTLSNLMVLSDFTYLSTRLSLMYNCSHFYIMELD
jgi:hypothetical protein